MAAISVHHYRNLVNFYTNAAKQILGVTDYYYSAAYEILLINEFDPESDLLNSFYNAYTASSVILQSPPAVIQAVQVLQNHILSKARSDPAIDPDRTADRFTDINQWIDSGATNTFLTTAVGRQGDVDTSFKVTPEFAAISNQAGFNIDDANIS